jgi:molybdopterin molybdotransferase
VTSADPPGGGGADDELRPLDRHRTEVLARIEALEPIVLPLLEAHGCVLAADVVADEQIPRFANSAMDGYAVHAEDTQAGTALTVHGEAAAGAPTDVVVAPGRAVRIMTGGVVPEGTGAIVPVELVAEDGDRIVLRQEATRGAHVRAAGEDVRAGDVIATAGTRLGAGEIGMIAAVGRQQVPVHPRPRVIVVSTGDELVAPGQPLGPGQLYDSNSYMVVAMVREAGAIGVRHTIVADDREQLAEAFEGAMPSADMIVTTGGVSAGRYDLVKRVLADLGDVAFTKVGMQPGKPQAFGMLGRDPATAVPCFGLPGNPVSAFVSFEVFVRPAIRRMQGRTDLNRPRITATLTEPLRSPAGKVSFIRVILRRVDGGGWQATPTGAQGSGLLHSVLRAHGLAEVPASVTEVAAGSSLLVHLLVDAS